MSNKIFIRFISVFWFPFYSFSSLVFSEYPSWIIVLLEDYLLLGNFVEYGSGFFDLDQVFYDFDSAKVRISTSKATSSLGLPQWGVQSWKGTFYPNSCAQKDFLAEYSKRLRSVEVSSTFYAPVSIETFKSWKETVSKDFLFLPKWPREISHDRMLSHVDRELLAFVNSVEALEENLGTTFLQLPPSFSTEYKRELFFFLEKIPSHIPVALEFRHSSWFDGERVFDKLEEFLFSRSIGMVCSDTPAARNCFHLSFPGQHNIIRYLSDGNDETDKFRLEKWSKWLLSLDSSSLFHFILHKSDNSLTPNLIKLFDSELGSSISDSLRDPQGELF